MSTDATQAEINDWLSIISRLYGESLSKSDLSDMRKDIANIVSAIESIRAVKLENGDEPAPIFLPYRKEN